jgi:hypothetical protein
MDWEAHLSTWGFTSDDMIFEFYFEYRLIKAPELRLLLKVAKAHSKLFSINIRTKSLA